MIKRLLPFFMLCGFFQLSAQTTTTFCKQLSALQALIEKEHYSPKLINDSLSKSVYHLFLESLDPDKALFTEADIKSFEQDEFALDEYILNNSCRFIEKYISRLELRIKDSKEIIAGLRAQSFDYSGIDTLRFNRELEIEYFKNKARVEKYWNKRTRYTILTQLTEEDPILENLQKNFDSLQNVIKPKVIENEICLLDEISNQNGGVQRFVTESFLNAFAIYQDPNTSFFNGTDKVMFENSVARKQMSFGISTAKNSNGEIVIIYVSPGSAAHKNGNFEEGDVIKSLQTKNEFVETYCVSNEDITAFINDDNHNTIDFRIKKQNGTLKNISLKKASIKVEENLTRGYVLDHKEKMGYINIPSFYTDLESPIGLGIANDVARELYKLEKEGINGLVLDLRFNGGGSMKEASNLCGMFIDRGPLSILRYKNGDTFTIKDSRRGALFKKPIVVLINAYSASASELFASVMQDYNRAVIVGAPSYGKSSAQVILPLNEAEDLGFCKVTVDRFYRVTGKSHQSKGVIPDIRFSSIYDNMETSEEYQKFAMTNDTVVVKTKHKALKEIPIDRINAMSQKRIANSKGFKYIAQANEILLNNYVNKNTTYTLTLENVFTDMNKYRSLWDDFEQHFKERPSIIKAGNTITITQLLKYNEEEKKANELVLNEISSDLYIEEAYNILTDYINLNSTN